jgi:glycine cleavage system H protein
VSEIFAPVGGKVVAVNDELNDKPELLNDDPYGDGWFFAFEVADPAKLDDLLDAEGFRQLTTTEG